MLSGNADSYAVEVEAEKIEGSDTLKISAPRINFNADVNDLLEDDINLGSVQLISPTVRLIYKNSTEPAHPGSQTPFRIHRLELNEPDIYIARYQSDSVTILQISKSENSFIKAAEVSLLGEQFKMDSITLNCKSAFFAGSTGKTVGVENGRLAVQLSTIRVQKENGILKWSGLIDSASLRNDTGFHWGNAAQGLSFSEIFMGNVFLSSNGRGGLATANNNKSAWLHIPGGQYHNNHFTIRWYNAQFDNARRSLSVDSFGLPSGVIERFCNCTKQIPDGLYHVKYRCGKDRGPGCGKIQVGQRLYC